VFLTAMLTGLRRCELKALRWEHVDLLEGTLRVVESKSEQGERLVAVPPTLAAVPANLYAGSRYRADSHYVRPSGARDAARDVEVVPGAVPRRARRGRDHGLHPALPRRPACSAHEPCGHRGVADRGHGDPRPPLHVYHPPLPTPRRYRVPRRGERARAAATRGASARPRA
jgi:integrase